MNSKVNAFFDDGKSLKLNLIKVTIFYITFYNNKKKKYFQIKPTNRKARIRKIHDYCHVST